MKVIGVDEAGKGPVIGPMIVTAVQTTQNNADYQETPKQLNNLDLRDSKKVSKSNREKTARKIKEQATDHKTIKISAGQIDELRRVMTMNEIMVKAYTKLLEQIDYDTALLDAADVNEERFAKNIEKELNKNQETGRGRLVSRHGADDLYPLVSAASILAKVERDQEILRLERETGMEIGTGYPHDDRTINYIEQHLLNKGGFPPETRKSWKTAKRLEEKHQQTDIEDYHD